MTRFRTLFVAVGLVGAASTSAHAGGILTTFFAGEDGHVTTSHPAAAYFNPAGLALRGGTRMVLEGSFGYRHVSYERPVGAIDNPTTEEGQAGTPQEALSANSGKAQLNNALAVPFAAVASDFGVKNLGIGVSLSVPFGGSANWDKNDAWAGRQDYPGAVDGVQRWTVITGSVRALYLTLAGGYYIESANLSIGAGVNLIQQEVSVLRARNALSTDDLVNPSGQIIEGRSLIDVSTTSLSASAGIIYTPSRSFRLGLSYQSQPDFGKSKLSGTLTNKFGTLATTEAPIDFEQELPDIIRFGGAYRPSNKLELRGQIDYQRWSQMEQQCVLDPAVANASCEVNEDGSNGPNSVGIIANLDRDWRDSVSVKGGFTYFLSERIELMGGLSFDSSAVPGRTMDPSFLDMPKFLVSGQGRFQLGRGFALSGRWTQVIFVPRETTIVAPAIVPTRVPSGAGKYKQSVGLFTLAAEYVF
jgi:long-chain fatty acid transport protein